VHHFNAEDRHIMITEPCCQVWHAALLMNPRPPHACWSARRAVETYFAPGHLDLKLVDITFSIAKLAPRLFTQLDRLIVDSQNATRDAVHEARAIGECLIVHRDFSGYPAPR
jgi:hypothetical protein